MTNTHDDATDWRDLADQLTPTQVAELEYCERENVPPGMGTPRHFLNAARAMIRHNLVQAICADIAPPADAISDIGDWEHYGDNEYTRMYTAWRRTVDTIMLEVVGIQHSTGAVERHISVYGGSDDPISAEQARRHAAALLAAADALERFL